VHLVDKTLQLTLKINADTSGLNKSLAGVGAGVKRVKVPVDLEASGEGLSKNIRVRLDGAGDDFGRAAASHINKATVQADFGGFVADQLANRIAKATGSAVEDAVRKGSKGDLLGAIGGLIGKAVSIPVQAVTGTAKAALQGIADGATATARTTFQGVVFGATQSASAELGQGISAGLQRAFGSTIGSPELIGRKLIERLGQSISQYAGKAAEAVGVDLPKVGQAVRNNLGEQEVLTDSRAKSAEERQVKTQRKESAQVELNRERQEAFRTQTAAVESYARITQSIERQSIALVKKNAETVRNLRSVLAALAAESAQDTAEPVDQELVKAFQLEIRKAKVSLNELRQARVDAGKELETALASATNDQEKSDVREQAKAYQAAIRTELQRGYGNLLNNLLAPAVELEQIQQDAKAKVKETFAESREAKYNFAVVEGGEAYRAALEGNAKVLDKQQIEIAERIQQQQQVLAKGIGIEAKLAAKVEVAPDAERDSLLALQSEAQRNIKAIAKEINDLKSARTKITDEIAALGEQARAIPAAPNKVIAELLKEFGAKDLRPEQIPQLQLGTGATMASTVGGKVDAGIEAQYLPELNLIQVRKDLFDALQEATSVFDLTSDQQRLIREEVFHAFQFDLGSLRGLEALDARAPLVSPEQVRPEEIEQVSRILDAYKPDMQQLELEAKIVANRGTSAAGETSAREAQKQKLFDDAGFGGVKATSVFNSKLQKAIVAIEEIEQRAKALGQNLDSTQINQAIAGISADLEKFRAESLSVAAGEFDSAKIADINQDFGRIIASLSTLDSSIADLSVNLERQAAEVKQAGNIDHALAIVEESSGAVSKNLEHLGAKLAPAANVVGGAIDYTTRGLVAVGKAGLALADKLGFAASSLIPGGALAYGPAKEAVKFAAPAVAAGALATQVPGATELISAISGSIAAILAPATSGLSASVGHAVSTEIAGALPSLFSALSHAVAESGLPGSQITAAAVEKLGGGLIHLLEPVISGVANTADSTIVSVGHAVNEFLGEIGGLLLAGKGLQEGVKLATSPEARSTALDGIQAVGSGTAQVVGGIAEGVEGVKDALGRTKRAIEQNIEEIKAGTQELAQGNLGAIADIKDSAEAAASNIARGAQDVGKAVGEAGQQVKEGVQKVAKVTLSGAVRLPDGLDIGELGKDALIGLAQQFKTKLVKTLEAEAQATETSNATGTGRSGLLKSDLNKILGVLIDKFDDSIETHVVEIEREFGALLPDLRSRLKLPEYEPIEVAQPKAIEVKAPAIELDVPKTTYDVPSQVVDVKVEEVELEVAAVQAPIEPKSKLDQFREQLSKLDEARDTKIEDIRSTYQALQKDVSKSKTAAKKGDVPKLQELQEAIATKRTKILKEVADLSQETEEILQALNALGIETGANTPIRDKISALRQSLTKTKKGTLQQVAQAGNIPGAEPFGSLQSINVESIQQSIEQGSKSVAGAFKGLVDTIFEVRGETLAESLALAAQSPRGKDLAVNTAGLAASVAASSQGPVAGIAADLVGALAARQALGGGGAETFGDITGFIAGNAASTLTGIPGSGAVAASFVVPQLQKLRDQIQARYGQPLDIQVPVDLQFEGLQSIDPEVAKAHQQVDQIDALLAELRQLEAEGKLVTPTVSERISGFLGSISKAFATADTGEIDLEIARIETELARVGETVNTQLSEEIQQIEQESDQLAQEFDKATGRIEASLYDFERVKDKVNDLAIDAGGRAEALGDAPTIRTPVIETYDQFTEAQNAPNQARRAELESEQQQQIAEIDRLIAEEQARLAEVRRLATEEQRLKIGAIDRQIDDNLAQLNAAKAKAQAALDKTKDPNELLSTAAAERRSPQDETLARIAQAAQQSKPNPALDKIAQAAALAKSERDAGLDAIALAVEQGRQDREQVNQRLAAVAAGVGQIPSNTGDNFAPLIAPQRPFSAEEKLEQQRAEGRRRQASAQQAQQQATATIQALDPQQALSGIEAIVLAAQAQQQAIDTVDGQLQKAAAEGKAKAENLTRRLDALGQESQTELPSNTRGLPDLPPPPPVDPVFARLAQASQEGAQQQNAVAGRLAAAAQEGQQAAQKEQSAFALLIGANVEIVHAAEESAKEAERVSNEAFKGLLAVEDAKAAQEQVAAKLKELYAQRDPIYDAPQPSLESDRLAELRKQREQTSRPIQDFQAEDLNQFVVPRQTFTPTGEERGLVAQQRLERDASERQINDTLRTGKAPTGSPGEIQLMADSAIASFEKNAAKFDAAAEQIESGSTRAQKALQSVGQGVATFKQKLADNGGVSGVLGKIGQSLSSVAEKAGLPVNTIGKLGNIIKGVGIAALAYVGITQLGDALVELGRRAFESYTKVELLQKRLKFVGGESPLQEDLAFIRKESERLKIPVDQLTESFTSLRIATKGTTLEGGKAKELAATLGTLGRVYGLTAEQTQSIQYQLSQTIRLGRAQGDELRSISDAGINIQGAIGDSLGKSGAEIADLLEKGQISADQTVDALIRLGNQAKAGLPDAMTAASVSVDSLKKDFVDVALVVGEKTAPLVVAGVGAIAGGIKLLEQAGDKLSPVFDAIGNGVGLILDIASPIVGVIGAIAGAIGGDLLDGIAIPFQAINAGLIEIREGFDAVAGGAGQALSAIGAQAAALGVNIPFLSEIIKYANPATIAVRLLGAAIGVFLVGQMIRMGVAVGSVVIPALISMAGTMTATVIPAIGAAVTASLAFIATPLGATIAAIGVIAAVAAPHMDELANAISGIGDAQVKANDRATQFNNEYQKSLAQLQKGIPLTAEELKKLKDGFAQNVKEGKDTASTAEKLSANLDRMQASAEAAAQIQAKLTKAMADATKAIKTQSQAIDAGYSTRLAGLNEALANQQITRERFDQEELAAQGEKSGKYLELYKTQGDNLRNALSEANARLAAPLPDATRTEVKKQVEQLQDQIYEIEQKGGEQRIALAQNRVKVTENIEKDRAKRAENEIKALENILATGTTAQIEVEQNISAVKQSETKRRIAEIDKQLKTEVGASGKLSEIAKNLYSERAVLETELTRIASEEATKRYDILLKDLEKTRDRLSSTITEAETEANIELQNAQNAGLLKQADVEAKRTNLTRGRLQKELALELAAVETLESLPSPTDPEKAEEHQKRIREGKLKTAQITQQIAENEYKRQESIRNLAAKALDEQVKGAENAATAIEQVGRLASNALERQNKILEAQKSLRASIVSLHDEEFKILIETETNEKDKANLQEKAAKFRLDSLRQSQALEERILELQIKQEQVQNRVAIIKAQAAVAKAQAEEAKVNANPESTDADKQAAALGTQAAQIELGATVESARLQEGLGELKRQQSQVDNRKELLGARFEYAKAIVDPSDRRDAIERVQATAARGLRERDQNLLPIGNKRIAPPPDYTQLDSASQQLGLTPKGVNLGRFIPPTPVDLHSGLNVQGLQQVGELGAQLKELRLLTQSGVAANLVTLVQQNQALSSQLLTLASRPQVQQNNYVQPPKRSSVLAGSGL
jgi:tape measure domain-containing protein